jgi:hypothetical protein
MEKERRAWQERKGLTKGILEIMEVLSMKVSFQKLRKMLAQNDSNVFHNLREKVYHIGSDHMRKISRYEIRPALC